ncbi:GDSL-type esterase/lipase family protein [Sphingobacterium suaedae]|uniref:GDSL-type esterase/lipase family protein n=1 Tax=Sphingobacterium suaedae TaxID=1686402 RepID=A0ABW5KKZ9_9SPHI
MGKLFEIIECHVMVKKQDIMVLLLVLFAPWVNGQVAKVDSSYSNWYYEQRLAYFNAMPTVHDAIVFLGNSITERAEWQELLADNKRPILNRGIGGDNSFGIRARMEEVLRGKPHTIFLMDGINDQFRLLPQEVSIANYRQIIQMIKTRSPKTKIIVQSALPINEQMTNEPYTKNRNELVLRLNTKLRQLAADEGVPFVDLVPLFQDEQGNLDRSFTTDGVHLIPTAYMKWIEALKERKFL